MSRREYNYQRSYNQQAVVSTSPEPFHGGEILPTYKAKVVQPVQYSARHYYSGHSNQSRSPVIRVNKNENQIDKTPQTHRQGNLVNNYDLQKTQNRRGNRSSQNTSEQDSNRNSQTRAADIIKRYSAGEDSKAKDQSAVGGFNQKHSVQTIDALNKKYGLGLDNDQDTAAKVKSKIYGYDSGMTVPHNFNPNHSGYQNKTDGAEENVVLDQFEGNSNDIESENLEYEDTNHKPIYQKETKIIQRRETVDPAVIARNNQLNKMEKSNSDKDLKGVVTQNKDQISNSDIQNQKIDADKKPIIIGDRAKINQRKQQRDKNPLSVISSEEVVSPSRGVVEDNQSNEIDQIHYNVENQDLMNTSKHQNLSNYSNVQNGFKIRETSPSNYGTVKDGAFDDRITVASVREADFYFQKYDSIPINDYLRYIGPIKNGKFHGLGRIVTNKGEIVYEGEFYQGKYDGKGKLWNFLKKSKPKQISIQAEIVANYMTLATTNYLKDISGERGILNVNFSEDNWEFYRGYFKDGKKHGCGKLKLTDGRIYEGEFVNGLANGYGMLHYYKKSLAGRWKDNMLIQFL